MSEVKTFNEAAEKVQEIMFSVVSLLNSFGITDVRAGAVMRLLGTTEEEAKPFDDKIMYINGDFLEMADVDEIPGEEQPPEPGTTLH